MCRSKQITCQQPIGTCQHNDNDNSLYTLWRNHMESNDREFKLRLKYAISPSFQAELISGYLMMSYNASSANSTPSTCSRTSTPIPIPVPEEIQEFFTPDETFKSPDVANIAIMDTPKKKKRTLIRRNLNKLFEKFQILKIHAFGVDDEASFTPTYHKFHYNCSLYDILDKSDNNRSHIDLV